MKLENYNYQGCPAGMRDVLIEMHQYQSLHGRLELFIGLKR